MDQLLYQQISQKLGIFPLSTLPCQETPPRPYPGDRFGCLGMERCHQHPVPRVLADEGHPLCCLSAWMEPLPAGFNLRTFHVFAPSHSCSAKFRVEGSVWEVTRSVGTLMGQPPTQLPLAAEKREFQECLGGVNTTPAGLLGSRAASRGSSVFLPPNPGGWGCFGECNVVKCKKPPGSACSEPIRPTAGRKPREENLCR